MGLSGVQEFMDEEAVVGVRGCLVVGDFKHKHLYPGSKTRFRW